MTFIEILQASEEILPKLVKLMAEIEKLPAAQKLAAREALGLIRPRTKLNKSKQDSET